mgnify:FL=1
MFKKIKGLISILVSIAMLLSVVMPITAIAASTTHSQLYFINGTDDGLLYKAQSGGLISKPADVRSVWFVDKNNYDLTGITTMDYSAGKDGSVLAWYDTANSAFYIGGDGKITAGTSVKFAFGGGSYIDEIHGLELLDTSKVTNMSYMFSSCGRYSKVFALDLGDNFDTSNVTNMQSMFQFCGEKSTNFTLDLGSKFNTSNVTNMSWMFQYCGANSNVFTLDFGDKFDTSKVTNTAYMFYNCGQNCGTFTLDLSGCNFNTSKVTDMRNMFAGCGQGNENFTLNLGNKFDTSKVTDMTEMFYECGKSSKKFTSLDVGGFTVSISNSRKLTNFASNIPVTNFNFGPGWAKAALPTWKMFTADSTTETSVTGAPSNLVCYSWSSDKRTASFPDKPYYTVTAEATEGGTAWDGGSVPEGGKITLLSSADYDYTFMGWYDGDTMVCETESFTVVNVTEDKTYTARFKKTSRLFSTDSENTLLSKAVSGGLVDSIDSIRSVSFVNMYDYDLAGVTTVDYSEEKDGRTLAWYDSTNSALYIGGEEKVFAEHSLEYALYNGRYIDAINGIDLLDTSYVSSMNNMFQSCGQYSNSFTLDLGDNFYTALVVDMSNMFNYCGASNEAFTLDLGNLFFTGRVRDMSNMFAHCGMNSKIFTLDFGKRFDTECAQNMQGMFDMCGQASTKFTELDLSGFTVSFSEADNLNNFASSVPVTSFIFGEGWANATLPASGAFAAPESTPTSITGATQNLLVYDWAKDNRAVRFTDKTYHTITAVADEGGTVSGGGAAVEGGNITLTAAANDGYIFDGWYDGDTKVCETPAYTVQNVTEDKTYTAKFAKQKISNLFLTTGTKTLITAAADNGLVSSGDDIKIVSFVDLNNYDLTNITVADYSAGKDESVLAWFDSSSSTLYIGGYGKIIAGESLFCAFVGGRYIDSITGFEFLDTSNVTNMGNMFDGCGCYSEVFTLDLGDNFDTSKVTDMSDMFNNCGAKSKVFTLNLGSKFDTSGVVYTYRMFQSCGQNSKVFTLDLGDKFDTSNVTNMLAMFQLCGASSEVFTLDLGDKFDTSNVTDMAQMFNLCGENSKVFKELDLSGFTINFSDPNCLLWFARGIPVTKFIFGDGWANAVFPKAGSDKGVFYDISFSGINTEVVGATPNLLSYNWDKDGRKVFFSDKTYYTITVKMTPSIYWGTISGDGAVLEGTGTTLVAKAKSGYKFDGWYDGDTKVCSDLKFTIENVTADKTYTAKFTEILYYKISAAVGENGGGTVSGGRTVAEGESVTLTAAANDGYTFDGWYDGDTKVCDTLAFTIENVSANKTYTAKFTKNEPVFDFTSLRTLRTKNITVDHTAKTIDIEAADGIDFITILVHQKEIIPGGTLKMASYLGNKVVYDKNGSYRIYFTGNFVVTVKVNITIDGFTKQYMLNVKFDSSKANFDFKSLKGENFSDVTVDHNEKTIHITANGDADSIILYVNQHDTVYGGKLRMASYLGNKVKYDSNGVYTVYANGKNKVSVKVNIAINGAVEQYLITIDFPGIVWGFDMVNAENVKNVSIDHKNKVITIDTAENCDNILLYIDQICNFNIKGQIWMKSYMGNKVLYNAADRTYTISKNNKNSILVKTKITMLGETRYYDIVINFTENN